MKFFENVIKKDNEYLRKRTRDVEANLYSTMQEVENLKGQIKDLKELHLKELSLKDKKIEQLQSELDILHKHFKLDETPSQSTRTAVRIDERVHELEIENAELKGQLYFANVFVDAFKPKISAAQQYPEIYGGIRYV